MLFINKELLPIKLHYFFFFSALGPVLPQLNVLAQTIGLSATQMGMLTGILPLLNTVCRPAVGYAVDYFQNIRKLTFMFLIIISTISFAVLWFLPIIHHDTLSTKAYYLNDSVALRFFEPSTSNRSGDLIKLVCHNKDSNIPINVYVPNNKYINTMFIDQNTAVSCETMKMGLEIKDYEPICVPKENTHLKCIKDDSHTYEPDYRRDFATNFLNDDLIKRSKIEDLKRYFFRASEIDPRTANEVPNNPVKITNARRDSSNSLYTRITFWLFVMLVCLGSVTYNVACSIADALCLDMLGPDRLTSYGLQRLWGSVGYGSTALVSGILIEHYSDDEEYKDFRPAFTMSLIAIALHTWSSWLLNVPPTRSRDDNIRALFTVLRLPRMIVFLTFALLAGLYQAFIVYYNYWFVDELSETILEASTVKMYQGIFIGGQVLIGEFLFFLLSDRIIRRWGYHNTVSFALLCYVVRLLVLSVITHPWQLVLVESIMQGPTFALFYSCVVGYAAKLAPKGFSATAQGRVGGIQDRLGFTLGSYYGGQLYTIGKGRTESDGNGLLSLIAEKLAYFFE